MEAQDEGVPEGSLTRRKERVGKGIGSEGIIVKCKQKSLRGSGLRMELAESTKGSVPHLEAKTGPFHPAPRTFPLTVRGIQSQAQMMNRAQPVEGSLGESPGHG